MDLEEVNISDPPFDVLGLARACGETTRAAASSADLFVHRSASIAPARWADEGVVPAQEFKKLHVRVEVGRPPKHALEERQIIDQNLQTQIL